MYAGSDGGLMADPTQPKPNFITTDFRAKCLKADPDLDKPEVVYRFSNRAEKKSTDRTESGVYKRP